MPSPDPPLVAIRHPGAWPLAFGPYATGGVIHHVDPATANRLLARGFERVPDPPARTAPTDPDTPLPARSLPVRFFFISYLSLFSRYNRYTGTANGDAVSAIRPTGTNWLQIAVFGTCAGRGQRGTINTGAQVPENQGKLPCRSVFRR